MHERAATDDVLVDVARRAADHVCATFGPDGRQGICGHAEIEVALAELARVTGERRYLDQAALFVERHGNGTLRDIEFGRSYFQDDLPVREATVFRGHAVRANYLAAGAVDVAVGHGRPRPAARGHDPVGEHRRPAHLHHRRAGLAPPGRGLRGRLRPAPRPGVLRDLRRDRIDHVQLAPAARHGRGALRRPGRADALQRRRDLSGARRHVLLLHEHPAPACPGGRPAHGRRERARLVVPAGALVRGLVLPAQRRAHVREPRRVRRDGGRRRPPAAPVRRRGDPYGAAGRDARRGRRAHRLPRLGGRDLPRAAGHGARLVVAGAGARMVRLGPSVLGR